MQSAFLYQLPPEVRNEIYLYTFTLDASELHSAKTHPLSMLLSCHKVYHEAVNLAFHTFAFPVSPEFKSTYLTYRNRISHLSSQQLSAISVLAYGLGRCYQSQNSDVTNVLANSMLLLPNLKRFEIHVRNGPQLNAETHQSPRLAHYKYTDPHLEAVEKYAPLWLNYKTLRPVTSGHCYSWQEGQKWSVEWPQLKSVCLHFVDVQDVNGEMCVKPYMCVNALGWVRGVHMCVCGCGEVCWLSADLVQQTGRRICIDTHFHGNYLDPIPVEDISHLKIRLRPGTEPLSVTERSSTESVHVTSIAHDADPEYWEGLRRRNWKIDALWRGLWRRSAREEGSVDESSEVPT